MKLTEFRFCLNKNARHTLVWISPVSLFLNKICSHLIFIYFFYSNFSIFNEFMHNFTSILWIFSELQNIKVHRSSFDLLHVSSIWALRTSKALRSFGAFSACLRISLFHNAKPLSVDLLLSSDREQWLKILVSDTCHFYRVRTRTVTECIDEYLHSLLFISKTAHQVTYWSVIPLTFLLFTQ